MKHSEKELQEKLREKSHELIKSNKKSKSIHVSIDGGKIKIEPVNSGFIDSCIQPKITLASTDATPLSIVEDVLAYKKAHKSKRDDKYTNMCNTEQCKCNGCVEYDSNESCLDDVDYNDDKYSDDSKMDKMMEDSYFDKNNDFKSPYEKMSPNEKQELKDLLEKSKQINHGLTGTIVDSFKPYTPEEWDCFDKINLQMFPNEKLIKEWKDYKSRVDNFITKHPKLPKAIVNAFMLDEYPDDERPVDGRPWEVQEFEKITTQMFETYKKKNADYGSSFDDLFDEFGMTSALIRMKDKYNRLKSITEKKDIQVKDESVEDTLLDLANYCILTVIKLRKNRNFKHASKFLK